MYAIMGNPLTSTPIAPVYMPMLQLIHLANVRGLRMPLSMTSQRCKNIQNQKLYIYITQVYQASSAPRGSPGLPPISNTGCPGGNLHPGAPPSLQKLNTYLRQAYRVVHVVVDNHSWVCFVYCVCNIISGVDKTHSTTRGAHHVQKLFTWVAP